MSNAAYAAPPTRAARGVATQPRRCRTSRRTLVALLPAGIALATLTWLRAPEPPGLDQSLFAFYGDSLARGLHLYRDLWDSKPPGIFALYAAAVRVAGVAHAALGLDIMAAAASALLAACLLRARGNLAMAMGALLTASLPSAPVFGGPMLAGQAEPLMTPLCLGAMLCMQRRDGAWAAGFLIGAAACLKLVALALLPAILAAAPAAMGWRPRTIARVVAGMLAPIGACALGLALAGTLDEAIAAVVQYPRAYAAEIASRTAFLPLVTRGATRLGRGMPLVLLLAAIGLTGARRAGSLARSLLVWIAGACAAILAQRQMAGYHLFLLVPPLALAAGLGAHEIAAMARRLPATRRILAVSLGAVLAVLVLVPELRLWVRHYRPHVRLHAGTIDSNGFLQELGGPGPAWLEAGALVEPLHRRARDGDRIFVWGLAPAVYARSGCLPFARWAFHQTLLVEGSPLSRRWPSATSRREALLRDWEVGPPRFVVIVRGDRSGLEPQESQAELLGFESLARLLAADYTPFNATKSYTLLERRTPSGHDAAR